MLRPVRLLVLLAVHSMVECMQPKRKCFLVPGFWAWNGYRIRYQRCGDEGPPVLVIHGFGGNWYGCACQCQAWSSYLSLPCLMVTAESSCSDHWRKNLPVLGLKCRAFAIDLLGYGYSDKPSPQ